MRKKLIYLVLIFLCACGEYQERKVFDNYDDGLNEAKHLNKKILLVFDFLGNPNASAEELIYSKDIASTLDNYVIILLKVDEAGETGKLNRKLQVEKYSSNSQPTYYILSPESKTLKGPLGYCRKEEFLEFIRK